MSYAQAQTALDALPADADRLAYATATVYAWSDYYVSYRSLEDLWGKAKTDATQAFVKSVSLRYDAYLSVPGDNKGTGGGVPLSRTDVQDLLAALPAQTANAAAPAAPVTQDDVNQVLAFARSNPRPRYKAEWGLETFDQSTLDRLADWVKWEALAGIVDALNADVDATLAYAAACPTAVVTYRASAPADLPAIRDALEAMVQDYRAKVAAGTDVADLPTDAAGAWAKAKGA